MTFNIDGFYSHRSECDYWENRINSVRSTLQTNSTDIIGLQEAEGRNLDGLAVALHHYECHLGPPTVELRPGIQSTYNPIFWRRVRCELLEAGGFYLSRTPGIWAKEWDSEFGRAASWLNLRSRLTRREL